MSRTGICMMFIPIIILRPEQFLLGLTLNSIQFYKIKWLGSFKFFGLFVYKFILLIHC